MNAVLLVSHGSRSAETKKEVSELTEKLRGAAVAQIVEFAFLELESPSIPDGIDVCVLKGASRITILLNFLNSGRHVDVDIPTLVDDARQKYPHLQFNVSRPIGQHPDILRLFIDLLR